MGMRPSRKSLPSVLNMEDIMIFIVAFIWFIYWCGKNADDASIKASNEIAILFCIVFAVSAFMSFVLDKSVVVKKLILSINQFLKNIPLLKNSKHMQSQKDNEPAFIITIIGGLFFIGAALYHKA